MKIVMQGANVGVQSGAKAKSHSALYMPDDANAIGIVRYIGLDVKNSNIKVGSKVYYGEKRQAVTMEGVAIYVMPEENILAIAEELTPNETPTKA